MRSIFVRVEPTVRLVIGAMAVDSLINLVWLSLMPRFIASTHFRRNVDVLLGFPFSAIRPIAVPDIEAAGCIADVRGVAG
jgi:hypothetical protein